MFLSFEIICKFQETLNIQDAPMMSAAAMMAAPAAQVCHSSAIYFVRQKYKICFLSDNFTNSDKTELVKQWVFLSIDKTEKSVMSY